MPRIALAALVPLLSLLVVGCPDDPRASATPNLVVTVAGTEITRTALLAELSRAGTARLSDTETRERLGRGVLDGMVQQELLYQAANAAGVKVDDHEVQRALRMSAQGYPAGMFARVLHAEQLTLERYVERVRRKVLTDRFLKERFDSLPAPSEEEVRLRWEQTSDDRPAAVHARQLLAKTEEEAKHLIGEIEKGNMSLADAARGFSVAPEKESGGDLGWFSRGSMPPVFDVCFTLEPGKLSGVVPSEYGFHVFRVIDKRAGGKESLEHARRRVEAELRREKQEEALVALVARLREESTIIVNEPAFELALEQLPDADSVAERGPDDEPGAGPDAAIPPGAAELSGAAIQNLPKAKELPAQYKKWRNERRENRRAAQAAAADAPPASPAGETNPAPPLSSAPATVAPGPVAPEPVAPEPVAPVPAPLAPEPTADAVSEAEQ